MRFAAGIIGILGALAGLFLGFKWYTDLNSEEARAAIAVLGNSGPLAGLTHATYALLLCGVIGLIVSALVIIGKGNKMANGGILIACGLLPLLFAGKAIFGVPMVLGGLLALAGKDNQG